MHDAACAENIHCSGGALVVEDFWGDPTYKIET
jgi:hypothetical protein